MDMPKVSIVLPVYNGEKYLRESLDSILRQSFTEWELIIVDDCSKDTTPCIVDGYSARDSRIHVIHNEENQRLPRSLNIGFREAKGDYLTWTSDDNIYFPDALQEMHDALTRNQDFAMVVADMEIINEKGNLQGGKASYEDEHFCISNTVGACFMYRREVIRRIGEYNPDMFLVEDYDYWLRIKYEYGEILRIPKVLYYYRIHGESLTATRKKDIHQQHLRVISRYLPESIQSLRDPEKEFCNFYYSNLANGWMIPEFQEKAYIILPWLRNEVLNIGDKIIIVFGAGTLGERAAKLFGEKVKCFADNDDAKIGKEKCDIPICSGDELKVDEEKEIVLIAVRAEFIPPIVKQLCSQGISTFATYQGMLYSMGKIVE